MTNFFFNGRRFRSIVAGIISLLILPLQPAVAQPLSSFQNFTHLTDFPQNTVQSLLQDHKGYIWIGTEGGLNRYDGKRVVSFREGNNDNFTFTGKGVNNMVEDDQRNLWIASNKAGVNIIAPSGDVAKNQQLLATASRINQYVGNNGVECISILRNRSVVLGTKEGICYYDPQRNKVIALPVFKHEGKTYKPFVISIAETETGSIAVTTANDGVFIFNKELVITRHFLIPFNSDKEEYFIINSLLVPGDKMFFATMEGLYKINLTTELVPGKLKNANGFAIEDIRFNCLAYDRKNNWVLAGSNIAGVFTLDSEGVPFDNICDSRNSRRLQSNIIYSLLVDDRGLGYWVGTSTGLTKFFYHEDMFNRFQLFDEVDGSPLKIYPIYTEDNKQLLVGTNRYLFTYDLQKNEGKKVPIIPEQPLRFNYISRVAPTLYLFATAKGIYYSTSITNPTLRKISTIYPELNVMDENNIFCILPLSENEILFGARGTENGGLLRWKRNERLVTRYTEIPGNSNSIPDNTVNYITRDSEGKIIVCTNKGFAFFDALSGRFTRGAINEGTAFPQVNFALPGKNDLWIGTYGGGLTHIANTGKITTITTEQGLPNNELYTLQQTSEDEIWVSTNVGLAVYNKRLNKIKRYDRADGLVNNEFNRTSSFKRGDTLYFGGLSGVTYLDIKKIRTNSLAPVSDISRIVLLKKSGEQVITPDSSAAIKVSYHDNTFKFYLSAPYYINAEKTTFHYRILPEQKEWINNGTTNELIITQLPPGRHQLELKTLNSEGIYSTAIKTVHITVTPPWYQTWWFRALLVLAVSAILFGFYKMRITQLKNENKIRHQLANDLHDDLGSTLNSVKVYSNLAMMEKENTNHLLKIKESTQDAIGGVRDLIWVLDDKKDIIQDLLARINQFAAPLCEANGISFTQEIEETLYHHKLGKEEKRNLYMIFKESINNSLKYSGCRQILLKIDGGARALRFIISDDGKGFEKDKVEAGNGLNNISSRAKKINYKSDIRSVAGEGTTITLEKI